MLGSRDLTLALVVEALLGGEKQLWWLSRNPAYLSNEKWEGSPS